jgi:hypothetical protein
MTFIVEWFYHNDDSVGTVINFIVDKFYLESHMCENCIVLKPTLWQMLSWNEKSINKEISECIYEICNFLKISKIEHIKEFTKDVIRIE